MFGVISDRNFGKILELFCEVIPGENLTEMHTVIRAVILVVM